MPKLIYKATKTKTKANQVLTSLGFAYCILLFRKVKNEQKTYSSWHQRKEQPFGNNLSKKKKN